MLQYVGLKEELYTILMQFRQPLSYLDGVSSSDVGDLSLFVLL